MLGPGVVTPLGRASHLQVFGLNAERGSSGSGAHRSVGKVVNAPAGWLERQLGPF